MELIYQKFYSIQAMMPNYVKLNPFNYEYRTLKFNETAEELKDDQKAKFQKFIETYIIDQHNVMA